MSNAAEVQQLEGLTTNECRRIAAQFHDLRVEFEATDRGTVWAAIGNRGSVFRERGDVVWTDDECNVLKASRSLSEVLEAVRG